MATPIEADGARNAAHLRGLASLTDTRKPDETGFKDLLAGRLAEVGRLQTEADKAVRDLAAGKIDNLHQVIVAVNEADLSFRLMMQVRNKLLEAYKEIMRMQV